jgi:alkanesulfonate monooxygenase SsuD/methylene tetrahydromethanopterin reductase-like flavin-dependent oxidoreductase (luciferase family)
MTEIGIMIEGQDGLNWERFFRLAMAVEEMGFAFLFRSDHLTSLYGSAKRQSLALWPSLTALALRTERIRFGPMVCSITFRHPSMLAKMAASVSVLSSGRLDLGLGAGWHAGEHHMFGLDYPPYRTRLEMLDEGAEVIRALWSGQPASFEGQHYRLNEAESYPLPAQERPEIIMGGKGEKTLQIVAKHATEWNCSYVGLEIFRQKSRELDENCLAIGRDPATLRRSLMIPFVIDMDEAGVQDRIDAHRLMFPGLPRDIEAWQAAGFVGGSPQEITSQLTAFAESGIERFMLQHNDLDDLASLELLAEEVLPYFDGAKYD